MGQSQQSGNKSPLSLPDYRGIISCCRIIQTLEVITACENRTPDKTPSYALAEALLSGARMISSSHCMVLSSP